MSDLPIDNHDLTGRIVIPGRTLEFIGSYSVVYNGKLNGTRVAVKIIRSVGALHTMRRKVLRERTVWEALDHPNILPFYGHADDTEFEPFGAFVSPWYSNGDASRFLERHGTTLGIMERVELWKGVLRGVAFLHGCGPVVIHGDLKPGNILIDDEGTPRICDFGLVRLLQEEAGAGMTTTTVYTGTERYLAPELLTAEVAVPTTESDVYALGCLGLEFVYLVKPYAKRMNNYHGLVVVDIRQGLPPAVREAVTDNLQDPYWDLIEECWNWAPERRPPATRLFRSLHSLDSPCDPSFPEGFTPDISCDTRESSSSHNGWSQDLSTQIEEDAEVTQRDENNEDVPGLRDVEPKFQLRARAKQDYTGDESDELSFIRGEILYVIDKSTTCWRARKADGTSGVVPSLYLTIITEQEETELLAAIERNNRESEPSNEESTGDEPALLFRARALYDCEWFKDTWDRHIASDDGLSELSFTRGDLLDIVENSGEWWHARKADGVYGNVPSYYLDRVILSGS